MNLAKHLSRFDKSLLDYFQVIIGSGLGRGLGLLNSILIARFLGPEKFGIFVFFFAVMMLTWLMLGSFDTVYIRRAKDTCDYEKRGHLSCNLIVKTVLGLLFFVCVAGVDRSVSVSFFDKDYAHRMMLAGIGAGLFLNFQVTQATIFREKEQFFLFTITSNIHTLLVFAALSTLWFSTNKLDLNNIITTYIITSGIVGTTSLIMILMKGRPRIPEQAMFRCSYLGQVDVFAFFCGRGF